MIACMVLHIAFKLAYEFINPVIDQHIAIIRALGKNSLILPFKPNEV
ncbi:MAG: hypothetical protein C5S45_02450 [Candidatus Methanocomedens sp.]|nr:MAG: hypothetical protein C5S45_02450 [ANME-2 cluster archaeon]